jgi:peroxiredoxin
MVTTLCLVSCVLATAQPGDRSEWLLMPRMGKGQELVYRGSYAEEAAGNSGVQFGRSYKFECRVLVLDTYPKGADLGLLTVLRTADKGERVEDAPCFSARLELAKIDLQGKLSADPGVAMTIPLDGPPSLEAGAFVETPRGRVAADQSWEVLETGRPAQSWKTAGTATMGGVSCVKMVGVQQTDDWEKPRADHAAWRRTDTVWFNTRLGAAQRVERIIERREPGKQEAARRYVLKYELESSLQYPAQLFEDRQREVARIHGFFDAAAPLLTAPAKNAAGLESLQGKIKEYLDRQSASPYREAAVLLKRRVDAARRGETVITPPPEEKDATPAVARIGSAAPDFLAPELGGKESVRPRKWLGKPALLVFYNPNSQTAEEVLRFAQATADRFRESVTVVGMAMTDDADKVRKQKDDWHLGFAVYSGLGLRKSYDLDATPTLMVLDGEGVLTSAFVGWGQETSGGVLGELKRAVQKPKVPAKDVPKK